MQKFTANNWQKIMDLNLKQKGIIEKALVIWVLWATATQSTQFQKHDWHRFKYF